MSNYIYLDGCDFNDLVKEAAISIILYNRSLISKMADSLHLNKNHKIIERFWFVGGDKFVPEMDIYEYLNTPNSLHFKAYMEYESLISSAENIQARFSYVKYEDYLQIDLNVVSNLRHLIDHPEDFNPYFNIEHVNSHYF